MTRESKRILEEVATELGWMAGCKGAYDEAALKRLVIRIREVIAVEQAADGVTQ